MSASNEDFTDKGVVRLKIPLIKNQTGYKCVSKGGYCGSSGQNVGMIVLNPELRSAHGEASTARHIIGMTGIERLEVICRYQHVGIGSAIVIQAVKNAGEDTAGFFYEFDLRNDEFLEKLGFKDPRSEEERTASVANSTANGEMPFLVLKREEFSTAISKYEAIINARNTLNEGD